LQRAKGREIFLLASVPSRAKSTGWRRSPDAGPHRGTGYETSPKNRDVFCGGFVARPKRTNSGSLCPVDAVLVALNYQGYCVSAQNVTDFRLRAKTTPFGDMNNVGYATNAIIQSTTPTILRARVLEQMLRAFCVNRLHPRLRALWTWDKCSCAL